MLQCVITISVQISESENKLFVSDCEKLVLFHAGSNWATSILYNNVPVKAFFLQKENKRLLQGL